MTDILAQIRTLRIEIPDGQGRPRIVLGMDPDGEPGIWILGPDGFERIHLGLSAGNAEHPAAGPAELSLKAPHDEGEVRLMVGSTGDASVEVTRGDGDHGVGVTLDAFEETDGGEVARVVLTDEKGWAEWGLASGAVRACSVPK